MKGDEPMISDLISRLPEEEACVELLNRFDKLLRKYSRRLKYEDSYEDLRLFFIELIMRLKDSPIVEKGDGYLVKYISVSLNHHYIFLSKNSGKFPMLFSDISEEQRNHLECISAQEIEHGLSDYFPVKDLLSEREINILDMHYIQGYSISEIANHFQISRQAINQAKIVAVNKIKKATNF